MGCCTGSKYGGRNLPGFGVGLGNSSFGDTGPKNVFDGKSPGSGKSSASDPVCLQDNFSDPNDLSLGTTEDKWPKWVKIWGCATIAALTLNEEQHKGKLGDIKLLTPENAEKLADCVCVCMGLKKDCKRGLRDGLARSGHPDARENKCLSKCKGELMEGYGIGGVELSSIELSVGGRGPEDLCPPLCKGALVVVGFNIHTRCWVRNSDGTWGDPQSFRSSHRMYAKLFSCDPSKSWYACFHGINREPQDPGTVEVCIDRTGKIVWMDMRIKGMVHAGQPGSCAGSLRTPPPLLKHCCEQVYDGYVDNVFFEEPCPDSGEK